MILKLQSSYMASQVARVVKNLPGNEGGIRDAVPVPGLLAINHENVP